jgi:F0F1-type ATP synthase beta subunit
MAQATTAQRIGRVVQVIGPVIDIEFPEELPAIYNAVRIVSTAEAAPRRSTSSRRSNSISAKTACARSR